MLLQIQEHECKCAKACVQIHTLMQDTPVSSRKWRNGEGSSFRRELFMLMLLNYLCYLCYCDVWLSLKEVYFGLSWQPVMAQEVRLYSCVWECVSLYLYQCVCVGDGRSCQQTVAVLCWHWGWASGNHPGDITLATGLSLGETVEAHPCRCRMTGCPLRTSNLERLSVRVCLCISVDFALAKISLSNPHRNTLKYTHIYMYE